MRVPSHLNLGRQVTQVVFETLGVAHVLKRRILADDARPTRLERLKL